MTSAQHSPHTTSLHISSSLMASLLERVLCSRKSPCLLLYGSRRCHGHSVVSRVAECSDNNTVCPYHATDSAKQSSSTASHLIGWCRRRDAAPLRPTLRELAALNAGSSLSDTDRPSTFLLLISHSEMSPRLVSGDQTDNAEEQVAKLVQHQHRVFGWHRHDGLLSPSLLVINVGSLDALNYRPPHLPYSDLTSNQLLLQLAGDSDSQHCCGDAEVPRDDHSSADDVLESCVERLVQSEEQIEELWREIDSLKRELHTKL